MSKETPHKDSTKEAPKKAPNEPPKLNDKQSHILLYPCQKCGQPTAFCSMRSIENEKNEPLRICVVCFDNHQKAKNAQTNVKSGLTSGSTFHKRVTKDAMKLIGIFAACILAICLGLFFTIRNRNIKKPQAALIAGSTDASSKAAKASDRPVANINNSSVNSGTKSGKPGDKNSPNSAEKPGSITASGNLSDTKSGAKSIGLGGKNSAMTSSTKDQKMDASGAMTNAELAEKAAALAGKDGKAKNEKNKEAAALTDPLATSTASKKANGGNEGKKPDESQTDSEPAKTASAADTVKQIESLIPVTGKNPANATAEGNGTPEGTSAGTTESKGGRGTTSQNPPSPMKKPWK